MDKSARIAILGAGAIGCTVAARLILAGYSRVSLIARGNNYNVLKNTGIHLQDLTGEYQVQPYAVVEKTSDLEAQDIVFIATKATSLSSLIPDLEVLLHDKTLLVPLINGIPFWYFYTGQKQQGIRAVQSLDPARILIDHFPLKYLIGAVVFITAELIEFGKVYSNNHYLLIFGEPNQKLSKRLKALQNIFLDTGIEARVSKQIRDQIWTKVIANLSSNPLSVITGATLKDIYSHPYLHEITLQMTHEIRQVAASYGARVSIDPLSFLQLGSEMGEIHTSMWHDYQRKQPLELAGIAEAVLELGAEFECALPMTRHIYQLTQYLSEKSRKEIAA
ncbi:2-dehydropantoate 2-reductase [Acinetobacter guillouiae]|jgi:2-dehydropantoate 2-reductase|uniref:ketopantoate reductase family protein n=1 Tax=Acinetobacter guillouiae TaxID=106649 RepID=UPI0028D71D3D|nr:2-dehydropantoate 2-reductase [Acinetobacter guillouiae]